MGTGLSTALRGMACRFQNEHEVQDDLSNPVIEVFIDYLRVLTGENCPESYLRLNQFVEADPQSEWTGRQNHNRWNKFFRDERNAFSGEDEIDQRLLMSYLKRFVNHVGKPKFHEICSYTGYTLTECGLKIKPILRAASASDLPFHVALGNLSHSESVKILTVHKSKGLEFHSVVFIGIEDQTFWGKPFSNERCAFFVGISRAKRRLVLTTADRRARPPGMTGMWNEARSAQEEFLGYAED